MIFTCIVLTDNWAHTLYEKRISSKLVGNVADITFSLFLLNIRYKTESGKFGDFDLFCIHK